jgi:hypothetical protein
MGFDHSLNTVAQIKRGVSRAELATALAPLLEYFGADFKEDDVIDSDLGCEIKFNEDTRGFDLYTCGEVRHNFDNLIKQSAENLTHLVETPGFFELRDFDTGDFDSAIVKHYFGPSTEAIQDFKKREAIQATLHLLGEHFQSEVVTDVEKLLAGALPNTLLQEKDSRIERIERLESAANLVLQNWAEGDLAGAVRNLEAVLEEDPVLPDMLRNLAPGDEVYWEDPDQGHSSGNYLIFSIVGEKVTQMDTILVLKNEAGSICEVFASELS